MRKGLLLKLKKLVSARNVGTSFLLGAFVLLVATYGAWRLQQLFSPDTGNSGNVGNTRIQLRSSDRTAIGSPLENKISGNDSPDYKYTFNADGPTLLSPSNNLFRIQGEVFYIDKQP